MVTVDGGYAKIVNVNPLVDKDTESVTVTIFVKMFYANENVRVGLLEKLYERGFVLNSKDTVRIETNISPFSEQVFEIVKNSGEDNSALENENEGLPFGYRI